jgi:hypothetical protein
MKIKIRTKGYYDTSHEYKAAFLRAGDCLTVLEVQPPPPAKSKTGLWCHAFQGDVFVESENYVEITKATGSEVRK